MFSGYRVDTLGLQDRETHRTKDRWTEWENK